MDFNDFALEDNWTSPNPQKEETPSPTVGDLFGVSSKGTYDI